MHALDTCSWHQKPHISTHDLQNIVVEILRYHGTGLFYHFWMLRWHRQLKCSLSEDKNQFILHSQFHDHWWPIDSTSQGICSHGIDLVRSEYSGFSVRRVNLYCAGPRLSRGKLGQCHGWWCPGSLHSQVSNSNDTDYTNGNIDMILESES